MEIRKATIGDLPRIMAIYARARAFMAETGNPRQWGPTNWPPEALIRGDIASGSCMLCVEENDPSAIHAVFFYAFPYDDATYHVIEDGAWRRNDAYGVVHRIASDGTRGAGSFCLKWAYAQSGHLRIDTHGDNRVMQHTLEKLGFTRCGIIHVEEDNDPRLAYEK